MFLGQRDKILARIRELIEASDQRADIMRIAVAFWGIGSDQFIRGAGRFKLLCNLAHPGTNPWVIARIMGFHNVEFKRLDELHAKVIIGSSGAFVGSANFSERALGLKRSNIEGWIEAGVYISAKTEDHSEACIWFDAVWETASDITEADLGEAKDNWINRGGVPLEEPTQTESPSVSHTSTRESESADPLDLFEEHVFEDKAFTRKSPNMTRMACKDLEYLYYQAFPQEEKNRSTIKVPAHAANLLWTLSGQSVRTNIDEIPEFRSPDMVIERSRALKTFERLQAFMCELAHSPSIRPVAAVRYWAQQYRPE